MLRVKHLRIGGDFEQLVRRKTSVAHKINFADFGEFLNQIDYIILNLIIFIITGKQTDSAHFYLPFKLCVHKDSGGKGFLKWKQQKNKSVPEQAIGLEK